MVGFVKRPFGFMGGEKEKMEVGGIATRVREEVLQSKRGDHPTRVMKSCLLCYKRKGNTRGW